MTLAPFLCDFDGTYASGSYRIVHSQVGFGIDVCDIFHHGIFTFRTTGQNALAAAQDWCLRHESGREPIPEVDLVSQEMMR